VVLIDPGAGGDFEGASPNAKGQAVGSDAAADEAHAIGKLRGVAGGVLSSGILVAFINLKIFVAERFQMFGLPIGIGEGHTFVDAPVECSPAPPTDRSLDGNARVMQAPNRIAVREELIVVVLAGLKEQALGVRVSSGCERETEFNLIFGGSILEIEIFLDFRGAGGVHVERCNFGFRARAGSLQMEQREKAVGSERAEEEALFAVAVVDELTARATVHPAGRFS